MENARNQYMIWYHVKVKTHNTTVGPNDIDSLRPSGAYMRRQTRTSVVQIMASLNQRWFVVNWTLGDIVQWTFNRHSNIYFNHKKIYLEISARFLGLNVLTHWGRVTHICVSKITIIGSDNGLSPRRRQAIIRTNAGILLIGPLGTNFSEISSEIHAF